MDRLYIQLCIANNLISTIIAGIIKRSNTWVAIIKLAGGKKSAFPLKSLSFP